MKNVSILFTLIASLLLGVQAFGQKEVRVLKNNRVVMEIRLKGQSALLTKNKIIKKNGTIVDDFQNSLKVFVSKFENLKNYNFEYYEGETMVIKKATIADTYSINDDELENIDKNKALLIGKFYTIAIYFIEVEELFSPNWSEYLQAVFEKEKSFLGILFNGRDMDYNADSGSYEKKLHEWIYELELEGTPLPLKVVGNKYGTGIDFTLGLKFSNSSTRSNKIFVGLELGTYVGELPKYGVLAKIGIGSDTDNTFIGIPLRNDYGSVYYKDAFILGARFNRSWGALSPRIHYSRLGISNLGVQLSFPF